MLSGKTAKPLCSTRVKLWMTEQRLSRPSILAVLEYRKRTSSNWLVVSANLAPFAAQLGNTPPTFEQIDAIMKKGAAPTIITN